jgi:uncharacterized protein (TIGR02145 family)
MEKYLGFVAVSVFLFSCADAERNNPFDERAGNYRGNASAEGSSSSVGTGEPSSSSVVPGSSSVVLSSSAASPSSSGTASSSSSVVLSSSSILPSSSSVVPSSSSNEDCTSFVDGTEREHYGKMKEQFCDERDGKKYVYVVIGEQTWMAENLNYNATGSKCWGDNSGNDSQNKCDTYGRLYNWATAMGFESSCNISSCSSQIQTKHGGVCPAGWHIPSQAEWNTLSNYVQSNSDCSSCDAKYLKANNGWNEYGNGTDQYEFSALPGGLGNSNSTFVSSGGDGYWLSTNESASGAVYGSTLCRTMDSNDYASWTNYNKSYLYSVRCLQD